MLKNLDNLNEDKIIENMKILLVDDLPLSILVVGYITEWTGEHLKLMVLVLPDRRATARMGFLLHFGSYVIPKSGDPIM